jgi:hypothetical protein
MITRWFPNAYMVELVQAGISCLASVVLLWALYDAAKDAMGLPPVERFGSRGTLAIGNIHRAVFRMLTSLILTIVGIASLFLPPPPPPIFQLLVDQPEMRLGAFIVRGGIILVTAILLIDAFAERFFRQRYVRSLRVNGQDKAPHLSHDRRRAPTGERLS